MVSVHDPVVVAHGHCEGEADSESRYLAPSAEVSLGLVMVLNVWEVELDKRHWVDGNTSVRCLAVSTDSASNRPEEAETSDPVGHKLAALRDFQVANVGPWDTLGACHVLTETVSDPWVISETLCQEFTVFKLLLAGRNRWQFLLEHNFELVLRIVILSVLL